MHEGAISGVLAADCALAQATVSSQKLGLARLLNRFGQRLCVLEHLQIEYPVGRAGSRFEALLPASLLSSVDLTALRHFVVQDQGGNRYPAVIERVDVAPEEAAEFAAISGTVVTNGS